MTSPNSAVRQRGGQSSKKSQNAVTESPNNNSGTAIDNAKPQKEQGSEWDFKITAAVLTVLAFVTRFWGINHPDQVVFDEVHFGKVRFTFAAI